MDFKKYVKIRDELIESMNANGWSLERIPREVRKLSVHLEDIVRVCELEGYVKGTYD